MKPKLPKPFYTARVGEALSSLTNYIREASRIADEIKPVLFADPKLQLDPDAVPPAPKLHHVSKKSSTSTSLSVNVTGQNLQNIHSFALIPAHDLSDAHYFTRAFTDPHGNPLPTYPPLPPPLNSVVANFGPHHLPHQTTGGGQKKYHYHAWVQDIFGQEDLLFNALPL